MRQTSQTLEGSLVLVGNVAEVAPGIWARRKMKPLRRLSQFDATAKISQQSRSSVQPQGTVLKDSFKRVKAGNWVWQLGLR